MLDGHMYSDSTGQSIDCIDNFTSTHKHTLKVKGHNC